MRESLNYNMIPIAQDTMNEVMFSTGHRSILTNVSSNIYYGYQPQLNIQDKGCLANMQHVEPSTETCNMDLQYSNLKNGEDKDIESENGILRHVHRKRRWEYTSEQDEFKKRRQNESSNKDNQTNVFKEDEENKLLEDILRETHGISIYHWFQNEV